MNNENFHPTLVEPPLAHALHKWDEEKRTLVYEYNGRNIITMFVPGTLELGFRHGSDGNLQNKPFIQQLYFMMDEETIVTCQFKLSNDAICMRPKRAGSEQAIIGQVGRPLIHGVNGLYDINQDLLIEWLGRDWEWIESRLELDQYGDYICSIDVKIGPKPFFINLRMNYYRDHLGYEYHKPWEFRPNLKAIAGWCSWEAQRRDVTQKDIEEASAFFSENLGSYGFEYIQLDDGFEELPLPKDSKKPLSEGWLATNNQFPEGHQGIVQSINDSDLQAGIWTNTNVTNTVFALNYQEHFLKDSNGELLKGEWIDYLMSCTDDCLNIHVAPYYKELSRIGYTYFKTDAIRHLLLDGLHEAVRLGLISNDDAKNKFRAFMQIARDNIGSDAYFLASWGVMPEVIGLVDSCRIAMDANPTWAGVRMQLFESARWFHTQRILFLNDPDHICARAKVEWTKSVTTLVSLTGSLLMLSDPLDVYEGERLEIIKKNLPPLETFTAETGPLDMDYAAFTWTKLHGFAVPRENPVEAEDITVEDAINMAGESPTSSDINPFSTLWSFHIDKGYRRWSVVYRVATTPLKDSTINFEQLNLESGNEYHLVDYWNQVYLGKSNSEIHCKNLDFGACQVIGVIPVKNVPHIISSFRHVSMGATDIVKEFYGSDKLTIEIKGIKGKQEKIWLNIPENFTIKEINVTGAMIKINDFKAYNELKLEFEAEVANISIVF